MGSLGIVLMSPCLDLLSRICKGTEPVKVQTLVPEFSLEAFDKTILHGLAGIDMDKMDLVFLCPKEEGFRSELRTVIGDEALWFSSHLDQPIEYISNHLPGD